MFYSFIVRECSDLDPFFDFFPGRCRWRSKTQLFRTLGWPWLLRRGIDFFLNHIERETKKYYHTLELPWKDRATWWFPTQLYFKDNVKDECQRLLILSNRVRPSTVANKLTAGIHIDCRDKSTPLQMNSPCLDQKIGFMGLILLLATLQAQKYLPDRLQRIVIFFSFYRKHKVYCEGMGQRTWTVMIYLNDVASVVKPISILNKSQTKTRTLLCGTIYIKTEFLT